MRLRQVHHCESLQPYTIIEVRSQTRRDVIYQVQIVDPNDHFSEWICGCEGFRFRGRCSHQEAASRLWCGWDEGEEPEQTQIEREAHMCPRCGGMTWITTEIDETQEPAAHHN